MGKWLGAARKASFWLKMESKGCWAVATGSGKKLQRIHPKRTCAGCRRLGENPGHCQRVPDLETGKSASVYLTISRISFLPPGSPGLLSAAFSTHMEFVGYSV